jgi:hypothetical protein
MLRYFDEPTAMQVPYWCVYSQMSTAMQNQGCQMDLTLGSANIPVSGTDMQLMLL